ncbi:MAG: family 16 glycosylhydrolase [Bacteroidota bacterium]
MKPPLFFPFLLVLLYYQCTPNQPELIWSDEFEINGAPNPNNWSFRIGDGCDLGKCGWGNNEAQYYTDRLENARVEDGMLIIEAKKDTLGNKSYSSARMVTQYKKDWKYGRVEVRAMLPSGKGTWPAIWMKSTNNTYGGWPESGEIDIMEHVGYDPLLIHGTVHTEAFNHIKKTQKGAEIEVPDSESTFHVYAIEWFEDQIDFFVDDTKYHTFKNENKSWEEWPFDQEFFLILNIAVGGNWGGRQGIDESIFPQKMVVDYVRVYKIK